MSEQPRFAIGDSFPVHFVWRLPEGDYVRAVFAAQVIGLDPFLQRYEVELGRFIAGRQEGPDGSPREPKERARDYWARVAEIPGARIHLAYEAADGRPLQLRLATLTGEHRYFARRAPDDAAG